MANLKVSRGSLARSSSRDGSAADVPLEKKGARPSPLVEEENLKYGDVEFPSFGSGLEHPDSTKTKLSVISQARMLHGVPLRVLVALARQAKFYSFDDEQILITKAGSTNVETNRFLIIARGVVELSVPGEDGEEVGIGCLGPGSVVGSLLSLKLVEHHLITVRRVRNRQHLNQGASNKVDVQGGDALCPLSCYVLTGQEISQLMEDFGEEAETLRHRALKELRRLLLPHLARFAAFSFFARYKTAFVKSLVRDMDLRICKPAEVIFQTDEIATSMAMLCSGSLEIVVKGRKVATHCQPGTCVGESALLEANDSTVARTATVQCGTSQSIICIIKKEDFLRTVAKFPEEDLRLKEQVRQKMTSMLLRDAFQVCDTSFIDFLSSLGQTVDLKWGQYACQEEQGSPEALHICRHGLAILQRRGLSPESLHKGDGIGFEAALGLTHGRPPDYSIAAGSAGCLLIRMTYEMFETALICFPNQIKPLLSVVGFNELPDDHPFKGKENFVWDSAQKLICATLLTPNINTALWQSMAHLFRTEVYFAGATISTAGEESDHMILLLHGSVLWEREGKVACTMSAPWMFDDAIAVGSASTCRATITAQTPCVAWHFPSLSSLKLMRGTGAPPFDEVIAAMEDAASRRANLSVNMQARFRNMKTFRTFQSEVLELISANTELRCFFTDEHVYKEGEAGESLFTLLKGKAEMVSLSKTTLLQEGEMFGEDALMGKSERSSTVRCLTFCICNVIFTSVIHFAFTELELHDPTYDKGFGQNIKAPWVVSALTRRKLRAMRGKESPIEAHSPPEGGGVETPVEQEVAVVSPTRGKGRGSIMCDNVVVQNLEKVAVENTIEEVDSEGPEHEEDPLASLVAKSLVPEVGCLKVGPQKVQNRFNNRKWLLNATEPHLPSTVMELYRAPPSAEQRLADAFKNVIPDCDVLAAARMHGVLPRSRIAHPNYSEMLSPLPPSPHQSSTQSLLSVSSEHKKRSRRAWPTYTTPLPPLPHVPHPDNRDSENSLWRSMEVEQCVNVAGQLQLFASGLLRIQRKTQLGLGRVDEIASKDYEEPSRKQTSRSKIERLKRSYAIPEPPVSKRPKHRRARKEQRPNAGSDEIESPEIEHVVEAISSEPAPQADSWKKRKTILVGLDEKYDVQDRNEAGTNLFRTETGGFQRFRKGASTGRQSMSATSDVTSSSEIDDPVNSILSITTIPALESRAELVNEAQSNSCTSPSAGIGATGGLADVLRETAMKMRASKSFRTKVKEAMSTPSDKLARVVERAQLAACRKVVCRGVYSSVARNLAQRDCSPTQQHSDVKESFENVAPAPHKAELDAMSTDHTAKTNAPFARKIDETANRERQDPPETDVPNLIKGGAASSCELEAPQQAPTAIANQAITASSARHSELIASPLMASVWPLPGNVAGQLEIFEFDLQELESQPVDKCVAAAFAQAIFAPVIESSKRSTMGKDDVRIDPPQALPPAPSARYMQHHRILRGARDD